MEEIQYKYTLMKHKESYGWSIRSDDIDELVKENMEMLKLFKDKEKNEN